jgi:hypothetical protein
MVNLQEGDRSRDEILVGTKPLVVAEEVITREQARKRRDGGDQPGLSV